MPKATSGLRSGNDRAVIGNRYGFFSSLAAIRMSSACSHSREPLGNICAANLKQAHQRLEHGHTVGKLVLEGF